MNLRSLFLLGALLPFGFLTGSGRKPVLFGNGESETNFYAAPENPTKSDLLEFSRALSRGEALPAGWVHTGWGGRTTIRPTGFWSWQVTVADDREDLSSATVVIDGWLRKEATRGNGRIVDRDGISIASLDVFAPSLFTAPRIELSWSGDDGRSGRLETYLVR